MSGAAPSVEAAARLSWTPLGVLPRVLPNAADRGPVTDAAVVPRSVVVLEPVWQRCGSGVGGSVALPVGPFSGEGLLVALDLPVAFGGARRDAAVLNGAAGEQVAERAGVDVGERVVGLQSPDCDAVCGVEGDRARDKGGDGRGALVCVQLGVGEAAVVV